MNLEEQYPYIWHWIKTQGVITIGDQYDSIFLAFGDMDANVWDSEFRRYHSLQDVFDNLEQNIKKYCQENDLEIKPEITEHPNFDRLIEVNSSMISAVKYISETKTLEAWFNSGQIWHYLDVPSNVFLELLEASSQGSYMRSFIIGEYDEVRQSKKSKRR